jgi:hypothetical protein
MAFIFFNCITICMVQNWKSIQKRQSKNCIQSLPSFYKYFNKSHTYKKKKNPVFQNSSILYTLFCILIFYLYFREPSLISVWRDNFFSWLHWGTMPLELLTRFFFCVGYFQDRVSLSVCPELASNYNPPDLSPK